MTILAAELTKEQCEAITHRDGPILIVAGPGAGKTDVIVRRTAYLVKEAGVDTKHILVTTFTNKAADELYDRLWSFLGEKVHEIHISTIHSFCSTLLHEYPAHGWGRRFTVLDEQEQFLFVYAHLRDLALNEFPKAKLGEFIADVIATFNLCTEECIRPEEFKIEVATRGAELLGLNKTSPESLAEYAAVAEAYGRYLELLRAEQLMDFATLQKAAYEMLKKHPEIRDDVAARFRYILVDEYQDTNRLQVLILKEVTKPAYNICAVGDDDQSIYRFRGATVSNFLNFEQDFPGAKIVHLNTNFRSTNKLLEATKALIAHNSPQRREKDLKAQRSGGVPPLVIRSQTCADEADAVIRFIAEARRKGFIQSYNEVAILFRSVKYHAQEYLAALKAHNIPFTVGSDGGFFDREDIIDLKTLIAFCDRKHAWDPRPLRGKILELSRETINAIALWKTDPVEWTRDDVLERMGVRDREDREALRRLAKVRIRFDAKEIVTLLDLFYELLHTTGYFHRCCRGTVAVSDPEREAALLNLAQFSELVSTFQRRARNHDPYHFGKYLLLASQHRALDALQPDPGEEAVHVMTVHQAKGLEFPIVVIGSAMQGRFPGRFNPPRYPVPTHLRLSKEREDPAEHMRDQRRLFYVAATRAQDILIIGAPEMVTKRKTGPSQFIDEMGQERLCFTPQVEQLRRSQLARVKQHAPASERISFSGLYSYLLCPLQYKLIYECGFAIPEFHWAEFGRIIHRGLELLHLRAKAGEKLTPEIASAVLEEVWRPITTRDQKRNLAMKETARNYLCRYVATHADRFNRIEWVEEDVQFTVTGAAHAPVVITGRIDLVCRSASGLEIIDFKVRSRKGLDALQPVIQVQIYGLACQEARKVKVGKLIVHLLTEPVGSELEEFMWDNDQVASAWQKVNAGVRGIMNRIFEPTPGKHCMFCDFRNLCPVEQSLPSINAAPEQIDEPSLAACP